MSNPYQAPSTTIRDASTLGFRPAGALASIAKAGLLASALCALANIMAWVHNRAIFRSAQTDGLTVDEAYGEVGLQLLLVPVIQLVVMIACIVIVGMWIFRAAGNARALVGAGSINYTPGWAVGWYFIPFANLWKPYQAMKDIWQGSQGRDQPVRHNALLPLWWTLWLSWNVVSNVSGRLSWRAQTFDQEATAALLGMVSDAVYVPLCAVLLMLVDKIQSVQTRARSEAVAHARVVPPPQSPVPVDSTPVLSSFPDMDRPHD